MTDNYVAIKIKADDGAKPDLTELRARLEELQGKVATARASVDDADADAKLADLQARLEAVSKKVASPRIDMAGAARALAQLTAVDAAMGHLDGKTAGDGEKAGQGWLSGFRRALTGGKMNDVSAQLGGSGLGKDMEKAGGQDGGFFHNSFVTTFLGGLKGTILAGVGMAMAALPALGAVAGVAMVAGLGAMVASKIPAVAKEFKSLGAQVMGTLETAVKPLVPFLLSAGRQLASFVQQIGPLLAGMFKAVGPMLQPLVYGLEGLVGGLLPGLTAILKAAMPAMQAFAGVLGGLGRNIGGMFSAMTPAIRASATVMKALFDVLGSLFPVIGKIAGAMAGALAPVLGTIAGAFKSLEPVLDAVGRVLAAFAQAFLVNLAGGLQAVAGLVKAIAPAFGILAGVLGKVFNLMNNRGVFNDIEDALEGLVGPIARVVVALVSGLAPILPPIISVAGQLAGVVQGVLIGAVRALVPVLVPVIGLLSRLLQEAVIPLLPFIVRLAAMLGGFLGQAVAALLPGIGQLAEALLEILIALTPLLPPLAQLITLAVQLVMIGLKPVIGIVTVLAGWLADLAGVVAVVVGWIAKAVAAALGWAENFGKVSQAAKDFAGWVEAAWREVAGAAVKAFDVVEHAVSAVLGWVGAHWKLLVAIILGPVGLIIDALATHWSAVEHGFEAAYRFVSGVISKAIGFIRNDVIAPYVRWNEAIFRACWDAVKDVFTAVWGFLRPFVDMEVRGVKNILSWFGHLGSLFRGWWDDAVGAVSSEIDKMIHFVESIPGRVNSALGGLPGMMYRAGIHVIENLLDGVTSQIGHIGSVMGGIASKVAGFFGLSPAKEGPLSAGGAPFIRGQHFAADIAQGMMTGLPGIRQAVSKVADTAALPGRGGTALNGAGGGGQLEVLMRFQPTGNKLIDELFDALKLEVRNRGGGGPYSAQRAFGRVWPA
jgi:phage-related protein